MVNNHATKNDKWALLIGINKYPRLDARYQLSGCVNDVQLINKVLQENFSFPEKNITLLLDEEATRQGILKALQELIYHVNQNDIVVIHYSGHGSRMTDREGDKPDGMDETIMPHDTGRAPHENRDITDDELYEWLLRLSEKTPYITLIFDSCHSGGIVREPFGANDRWVESDTRPIEQLPPSPLSTTRSSGGARDIGSSGWLPMSDRYVLIAGCTAAESSWEYWKQEGNSQIGHGALTYFLCQELRSIQSDTTYRDIFQRVSTQVTGYKSVQHPQMEGAQDREFFYVDDIEPMRFVSIVNRKDNKVILGAGAAHGMTEKSEWAIYHETTKQIGNETLKLGKVKITAVRAVTSDAQILEENQVGVITVGSRATEEAHFYGEMSLKVNIQVPPDYDAAKKELIELIKESKLLRFAQEGETADVMVYIIAPRSEVSSDAPVPQLGVVNQPTWVLVGNSGQVLMPTCPVDRVGATTTLRENLEKIVRCKSVLALENPNSQSLLKNKVKLTLKQQAGDGNWIEAQPDKNSGQIVFENGDRLILEVENLHNASIYIYILDLGLAYGVTQIYPIKGANQEFQPGKHNIGIRQNEHIELYLPEKFPYVSSSNDGSLVGGIETFKLFATTYPTDFSWLLNEGVRQGFGEQLPNINKPLEQLLDIALTGNGNREARVITLSANEEWITVQSSFWLRRKMF
ncbi:caspase family protein [Nostoc sp. FACHB-152]|uniref:caspase family protein n=1 Tax=Nostoc sp. FACHB-152 TaxID=2692837 RepID=UPI001683F52E|nr:caspase family protein [Nostoc sp. FACHB-152]MBD2452334.1 caspase family protein [Nostoc sp. FACHB-152]